MSDSANQPVTVTATEADLASLRQQLDVFGRELGFQQIGVTDTDLGLHEERLKAWLAQGYHGDMGFMADHGNMRSRPAELQPNTVRVISARMDYLPPDVSIKEQLPRPILGLCVALRLRP